MVIVVAEGVVIGCFCRDFRLILKVKQEFSYNCFVNIVLVNREMIMKLTK